MRERIRIQLGAIEQVQRAFKAAPHQEVKDVDKSEAIRMLAGDIEAMKSKGYSLVQIAGVLSDNGVPITPIVLKNYLGLAKGRSSVRKAHNKRPRAGQSAGNGRGTRLDAGPPASAHVAGEEIESASESAGEKPATIGPAVGKEVTGQLAENAAAMVAHVVEKASGPPSVAAREDPVKSAAQSRAIGAAVQKEVAGKRAENAPATPAHVVEKVSALALSTAREEPGARPAQSPAMGPPIRKQPAGQSAGESARRSAFIPRDDSEDI